MNTAGVAKAERPRGAHRAHGQCGTRLVRQPSAKSVRALIAFLRFGLQKETIIGGSYGSKAGVRALPSPRSKYLRRRTESPQCSKRSAAEIAVRGEGGKAAR
jgi:hypothetical protein